MALNFSNAEFIRSAADSKQFIRDGLPQIVFAGRSNVGKSSAINRLTGRKNFARVGSAPGKTSQINYFSIDRKAYLVDLPGYGYAKVSKAEKERWGQLMESYFQDEGQLISIGALLVDARPKPTGDDCMMCDWFRQNGCPVVVVANKMDKLKASQREEAIGLIRQTLQMADDEVLIPFSAERGEGKEALIQALSLHCE